MAVGSTTSLAAVNADLTNCAVQMRNLAALILERWAYYNKLGLAGLEALGFSAADAQAVLDNFNHMVTSMQVYKGTVQAGGSVGTGAVMFNFEDYLTPLWAGQ
jgi:hypothetical protein